MLDRALQRINYLLFAVAAAWMFCLALLIVADVIGRDAFNTPIVGTPELVANSVVFIAFCQLAYAVQTGGVIRAGVIDALISERWRPIPIALGNLAGAVLLGVVGVACWDPMVQSWTRGEYAGVEGVFTFPVTPIRFCIVAGSVLAAFNYLVLAARELNTVLRR